MKLIFCMECEDIVKLTKKWRKCRCKKSGGKYLKDGDSIEIFGSAKPFGIGNGYFALALKYDMLFFGWFYGDLVPDHDKITRIDAVQEEKSDEDIKRVST